MKETWYLGTTPTAENCSGVGDKNYTRDSKLEIHIYIHQLVRTFGLNPEGTRFKRVSCPHDFGTYYEIEFHFNDEDSTHVEYALAVENGCEFWDSEAIAALKAGEYSVDLSRADGLRPDSLNKTQASEHTAIDDALKNHLYVDRIPSDEDPFKN